jgi:hypothetical protein
VLGKRLRSKARDSHAEAHDLPGEKNTSRCALRTPGF